METRLTYEEIAAWLTMSVRDVRRKVADGSIPAKRVGRRILFDPAEVWAALPSAATGRSRGLPPSPLARTPLEQVLRTRARRWYEVPDELAAKRAEKEGRHGT